MSRTGLGLASHSHYIKTCPCLQLYRAAHTCLGTLASAKDTPLRSVTRSLQDCGQSACLISSYHSSPSLFFLAI